MFERWRGILWAGTAAAICGALVGSLLTGSSPHLGLIAGVILVAIGVTIALQPVLDDNGRRTTRFRQGRAAWREGRRSRSERHGLERDRQQQSDEAWETVGAISHVLDRDDIDWLVSTDFTGPWRSQAADPCVELMLRVSELADRQVGAELGVAVDRLTYATASFLDFYAANTLPDPILREDEWRNVVWGSGDTAELTATDTQLRNARSERLRELSAELAEAYESFVRVARRRHGARGILRRE